jgi:hypothetical protein
VLLWHVSQGALVARCRGGFPVATALLWHLAQFATVPAWFMRPVVPSRPDLIEGVVLAPARKELIGDVVLVAAGPDLLEDVAAVAAVTAPGANIAPFHVLVLK